MLSLITDDCADHAHQHEHHHGEGWLDLFQHALLITAFIAVIMILVEFLNNRSKGTWQNLITRNRWSHFLLAIILGATPGCLGSFMLITMYTHRVISLGAVVTGMIVTSGDEAFFMLSRIPDTFLLYLLPCQAGIGLVAGLLTDYCNRKRANELHLCRIPFHSEKECYAGSLGQTWQQLRHCSALRGVLLLALGLFLIALIAGQIGPQENWAQITLMALTSLALLVITLAQDHFLEAHLWGHVLKVHIPRIFIWVFAVMGLLKIIPEHFLDFIAHGSGTWILLGGGSLLGVIPESGPHLLFVEFFSAAKIPFSVLLANSIVQDGHGMLPLLAHSRKDFFLIKGINLLVGLIAGAILLLVGW